MYCVCVVMLTAVYILYMIFSQVSSGGDFFCIDIFLIYVYLMNLLGFWSPTDLENQEKVAEFRCIWRVTLSLSCVVMRFLQYFKRLRHGVDSVVFCLVYFC